MAASLRVKPIIEFSFDFTRFFLMGNGSATLEFATRGMGVTTHLHASYALSLTGLLRTNRRVGSCGQ